MPENIKDKFAQKVYESDASARLNVEIGFKYKIKGKKLMLFGDILNAVLLKKIKITDLVNELKNRLKINPDKAKKMAAELAGRKFLILDKYFGGEVSNYLRSLGAKPEDYAEAVDLFKKKLNEEDKLLEEEPEIEIPAETRKIPEEVVLREPEKESKDIGLIFDKQLVDFLKFADFRAKSDLNMLIMKLFLEKPEAQKDFILKMTNNPEIITTEKIEVGGQLVGPTIGNWLKDFISIVGVEGTVSSIQKARYMAESHNAKKLNKEESQLLDMMFDTYVAIRNVYKDAERKDLGDIYFLPYTEKDADEMREYAKEIEKEEAKTPKQPPRDIFELYVGTKEEQAQIEAMKKNLVKATQSDVKKISDELEVGFLKKDKFKTIAALMLLVEKGGFINLLKEDIRYRDYLTSYLNRIGKAGLVNDFVVNPTQPQFVVYLLKYILQERAGLSEEESARIASHFDTIYTKRGQEKYSRLAYYDLVESKFKWA